MNTQNLKAERPNRHTLSLQGFNIQNESPEGLQQAKEVVETAFETFQECEVGGGDGGLAFNPVSADDRVLSEVSKNNSLSSKEKKEVKNHIQSVLRNRMDYETILAAAIIMQVVGEDDEETALMGMAYLLEELVNEAYQIDKENGLNLSNLSEFDMLLKFFVPSSIDELDEFEVESIQKKILHFLKGHAKGTLDSIEINQDRIDSVQHLIPKVKEKLFRALSHHDLRDMVEGVSVGEGGMGQVFADQIGRDRGYKIRDPKFEISRGIFKHPEQLQDFYQMTQSHHNIADYYRFTEASWMGGIHKKVDIFRLLDGEVSNLDESPELDYLDEPELKKSAAISFMVNKAKKLTDALAHAHQHGYIHCDIKPQNVIINEKGDLQLIDWDTGLRVDDPENKSNFDKIAGTPAFMSPEQLNSDQLTTASDIYSFGITLYRLFGGKTKSVSVYDLLAEAINGKRTPDLNNMDIPAEIKYLIRRCTAYKPKDRPTAAELSAVLEQMKENLPDLVQNFTPKIKVEKSAGVPTKKIARNLPPTKKEVNLRDDATRNINSPKKSKDNSEGAFAETVGMTSVSERTPNTLSKMKDSLPSDDLSDLIPKSRFAVDDLISTQGSGVNRKGIDLSGKMRELRSMIDRLDAHIKSLEIFNKEADLEEVEMLQSDLKVLLANVEDESIENTIDMKTEIEQKLLEAYNKAKESTAKLNPERRAFSKEKFNRLLQHFDDALVKLQNSVALTALSDEIDYGKWGSADLRLHELRRVYEEIANADVNQLNNEDLANRSKQINQLLNEVDQIQGTLFDSEIWIDERLKKWKGRHLMAYIQPKVDEMEQMLTLLDEARIDYDDNFINSLRRNLHVADIGNAAAFDFLPEKEKRQILKASLRLDEEMIRWRRLLG